MQFSFKRITHNWFSVAGIATLNCSAAIFIALQKFRALICKALAVSVISEVLAHRNGTKNVKGLAL
jgi:hypothetical protein